MRSSMIGSGRSIGSACSSTRMRRFAMRSSRRPFPYWPLLYSPSIAFASDASWPARPVAGSVAAGPAVAVCEAASARAGSSRFRKPKRPFFFSSRAGASACIVAAMRDHSLIRSVPAASAAGGGASATAGAAGAAGSAGPNTPLNAASRSSCAGAISAGGGGAARASGSGSTGGAALMRASSAAARAARRSGSAVPGRAGHSAGAVDGRQRAPLSGREGDIPLLRGTLREPEPRPVVRDDLADRADPIALLGRAIEQLIEIAGEIRRGHVAPRDELERAALDREAQDEHRLAAIVPGDRRDQTAAVEAERAVRIGPSDLELAGLVRGVDELNDRLEREGLDLAAQCHAMASSVC